MAEQPNDQQQQQLWNPTDSLQDWPAQWPQMHAAAVEWMKMQQKLTLRNGFMLQFLSCNVKSGDLLALQTALVSLAQLTFNLLMFPWKQEQSRLQTCTGFFVHTLNRIELIDELLKQMGYVAIDDADGTKEYQLHLSSGSENDNSDESCIQFEKQLRRLFIDLLNAETAVHRMLSKKLPLAAPRDEILNALANLFPQLHREPKTSADGDIDPALPSRAMRSGGQQQQPAHLQQQQPAQTQPKSMRIEILQQQQQPSRPAAKLAHQQNSSSEGLHGNSSTEQRPIASMSARLSSLKESSV